MDQNAATQIVHPLHHMEALRRIACDLNGMQATQGAGGETLTNAMIPFVDKHSLSFDGDFPEHLSGSILFPKTREGYAKVVAAARQAADELESAKFHYVWQPNHAPGLGNRRRQSFNARLKTVATLRTIADRLDLASEDPNRWKRGWWE